MNKRVNLDPPIMSRRRALVNDLRPISYRISHLTVASPRRQVISLIPNQKERERERDKERENEKEKEWGMNNREAYDR